MAAACGGFPSRCKAVKLSRAHLFFSKGENEDLRKARKPKSCYVGLFTHVPGAANQEQAAGGTTISTCSAMNSHEHHKHAEPASQGENSDLKEAVVPAIRA